MSEGVEWAVHCCLNLTWADADRGVPAARLAALYQLPSAYLNKQLQALVRDGILTSTSGPRGGFRLGRHPADITLLDIVTAIEGADEAFRCTEIRRRTPWPHTQGDFRDPCLIHQAMGRADLAWRRELAAQTLADVKAAVERSAPGVPGRTREWLAATPH